MADCSRVPVRDSRAHLIHHHQGDRFDQFASKFLVQGSLLWSLRPEILSLHPRNFVPAYPTSGASRHLSSWAHLYEFRPAYPIMRGASPCQITLPLIYVTTSVVQRSRFRSSKLCGISMMIRGSENSPEYCCRKLRLTIKRCG